MEKYESLALSARIGMGNLIAAIGMMKSFGISENEKIYEKSIYNEFKTKRRLRKNALILYITLHFLRPNQDGIIDFADLSLISNILGVKEPVVRENLKYLEKYGYIKYEKYIPHVVTIQICDYDNMNLTANEGGRGYYTMSKDIYIMLQDISDLNDVRLFLRLLSCEHTKIYAKCNKGISLKELTVMLPSYCSVKDVKKALLNPVFDEIFHICSITKNLSRIVKISVKEAYDVFNYKLNLKKKCIEEVKARLSKINEEETKLGIRFGKHWFPTPEIMSDIGNIALSYPIKCVTDAVSVFFNKYIKKGKTTHSPAAMIRTLTKNLFGFTCRENIVF